MLYFAYGSNLSWSQMKERCPSAEFVTVAKLKGYRLDFTLESPPEERNGGVADVVRDNLNEVWGVIYDIGDPHDWLNLDRCEGFQPCMAGHSLYLRRELKVHPHPQPENSLTLSVQLYEVRKKAKQTIPPHPHYKELILQGARHWELPEEYIELLVAVPDSVEVAASEEELAEPRPTNAQNAHQASKL